MWQCRCATDNLHPAELRLCERCNTIAPPDLPAAPALGELQTQRLLGFATWLDGYLAGKENLDPVVAGGVGMLMKGARERPAQVYALLRNAGDALGGILGWVDEGREPDRAVFDRLLSRE